MVYVTRLVQESTRKKAAEKERMAASALLTWVVRRELPEWAGKDARAVSYTHLFLKNKNIFCLPITLLCQYDRLFSSGILSGIENLPLLGTGWEKYLIFF